MSRRLSPVETKRAINTLRINRPFDSTFGILDEAENVRYDSHSHRQHQLLFPEEGILFVETAFRFFICTPQIGLWIPAKCQHATTTKTKRTLSAFFSPLLYESIAQEPVMIEFNPLLREAMKHVTRSQTEGSYETELFKVMHGVASENVLKDPWWSLPIGSTHTLRRTIDILIQELNEITVECLAKKSGQSERTMRRRFMQELGIGPELYIQRVKVIRAMQILKSDPARRITEVALDAGYSNHSAFSSAFKKLTGVTPIQFRNDGL